jgi:anaerobic magnesium-protoporphyrin IX monomethyl ester cyclase
VTKANKIKIAFVSPPVAPGHPQLPPLGLTYLAAVLEPDGYEIRIIDCPVNKINHEKLRSEITAFQPDLVGISAITPTIKSALQSAHLAKEECPDSKVIIGGPHATFMDTQILSEYPDVDVIVRGEGERTIRDLTQNLFSSGKLQDVPGICFRKEGQAVRTRNRPLIENLDELPHPAYHYLDLKKYRIYGKTDLPIMTSRGCPYQCAFCVSSQMFGPNFRMRSPKHVVDELEWLRDEHGADGISFCDDTLTLDRKRMHDICEEIKNRKVGLPWGCQTRVDQIPEEILIEMRKAKCELIHLGLESGNQEILDAVGKCISIEQIEKAVKLTKEQGMFAAVTAIIGYPGETKDTVKKTLDLIRRIDPDDAWLCTATPYPGTKLRELVKSMGWKTSDDWDLYNMAQPVFENPVLPSEDLIKIRRKFYASMYTWRYVFRQTKKGYVRGNFYSRIMARTALNHMIWRFKSHF